MQPGPISRSEIHPQKPLSPINKAEIDIDEAEDKYKMFIGGLHKDTTHIDLYNYFLKFGEVDQVLIKYDQATKVPRGFGFILFKNENSVHQVLNFEKEHVILDKVIDPKRAQPHNTLPSYQHKLFLGGVSSEKGHTVESLVSHFSKYGEITQIVWPDKGNGKTKGFSNFDLMKLQVSCHGSSFALENEMNASISHSTSPLPDTASTANPSTCTKKVGYCFIIFENIDSVAKAAAISQHSINGYVVEAKICDKSVSRKTAMNIDGKVIPAKEDTAKYRCYEINHQVPAQMAVTAHVNSISGGQPRVYPNNPTQLSNIPSNQSIRKNKSSDFIELIEKELKGDDDNNLSGGRDTTSILFDDLRDDDDVFSLDCSKGSGFKKIW